MTVIQRRAGDWLRRLRATPRITGTYAVAGVVVVVANSALVTGGIRADSRLGVADSHDVAVVQCRADNRLRCLGATPRITSTYAVAGVVVVVANATLVPRGIRADTRLGVADSHDVAFILRRAGDWLRRLRATPRTTGTYAVAGVWVQLPELQVLTPLQALSSSLQTPPSLPVGFVQIPVSVLQVPTT